MKLKALLRVHLNITCSKKNMGVTNLKLL